MNFFVCRKDDERADLLYSQEARKECPTLILDFLEKNLRFDNDELITEDENESIAYDSCKDKIYACDGKIYACDDMIDAFGDKYDRCDDRYDDK